MMNIGTKEESITSIKKALHIEAEGILNLEKNIDEKYETLIEMCAKCCGKLIITGMGKSGHVARKISATMASLGTPSFFLHPAEAAHGDLGMVEENDVVIMISKSGETEEVLQLVNSLKIIGCKLIGIVCKEKSSLQRYCDLTIVIPVNREACVNNLAPTTSTTVTMALGDAIAVTLSKLRGFRDVDFALYHPKGTLGKRLLTTAGTLVKLKKDDVVVTEGECIEKVLWVITNNHLGAVAIVDKTEKLIGLVTDGDIRRNLDKKNNVWNMAVSEIMTRNPIVVKDSMLAVDVFKIMQKKKVSVVPVVNEENILISMISMHDIISTGIIS